MLIAAASWLGYIILVSIADMMTITTVPSALARLGSFPIWLAIAYSADTLFWAVYAYLENQHMTNWITKNSRVGAITHHRNRSWHLLCQSRFSAAQASGYPELSEQSIACQHRQDSSIADHRALFQ